jgi:hypothetical protein
VSIWTCSLPRDKPQSRRGRIICHHAFNSRFAVTAVLAAVGGIDARAHLPVVVAEVFDTSLLRHDSGMKRPRLGGLGGGCAIRPSGFAAQ